MPTFHDSKNRPHEIDLAAPRNARLTQALLKEARERPEALKARFSDPHRAAELVVATLPDPSAESLRADLTGNSDVRIGALDALLTSLREQAPDGPEILGGFTLGRDTLTTIEAHELRT